MTKKRIVITVTSIITVIVSAVLIYILLQSNSNEPTKPEDKKISLATLINRLEDQKIDFDDIDTVDTHRYYDGKLFLSLLKKSMNNPSQYLTKEIGYVNLETMEYNRIKYFETDVRIYDYVYYNDSLVYSAIGTASDEGITVKVIQENNGIVAIIDQMKTLSPTEAPIFTIVNNQIFYHYKHVEESLDNGVTMTMAFRKYDLTNLFTVEEHTCSLNLDSPSLFGPDCIRSDGRVYNSGDSTYYLSTNGITSALNIYNSKSNNIETVVFDHFVPWSVYNENTQNVFLGEYTDDNATFSKISSYNINTKEQTEIFSKIGFSRPIVSGNKLIFLDEYSTPTLQTIILNLDTYEYQKIKGFDTFIGFPKYYVHNNKVYAVWSNKSVGMQVFEFVE